MSQISSDEVARLQEAFRRSDANSALEGIVPTGFQLLQRERVYRGEMNLDEYGRLVLDHAMTGGDLTAFEAAERESYMTGAITIGQYCERVLRAAKGSA